MTSLAEQLRRLAIPQALQQRESRKRASLLFNEKDAANLDRDAIFEIGLEGMRELIQKNSVFEQFLCNIFHFSSKSFERVVQSSEVNRKIDETIGKFLRLLSPYVLLKPAHQALEWLICRYHIHDFNTNDLMALVLPYHETKIFAKVLQLINLRLPSSGNFAWLETIQKEGVHLPKLVLVNHLISDSSFLRFICEYFLKSVEEYTRNQGIDKLGTLTNFYCITLINTLARKEVTDHHLTIVLPSLISALSSESLNVKAAAYMVCGQLVVSHELSKVLLNEIIQCILNNGDGSDHIQREKILLLVLIFQRQKSASLPANCETHLPSLKSTLSELYKEGIYVDPLLNNLGNFNLETVHKNVQGDIEVEMVQESSCVNVQLNMCDIDELKGCSGDEKESAWLKLRPQIIVRVNDEDIFKELCEVAPSYDKLVLLLCINNILKKDTKQSQIILIRKLLKSNFGKTNPYLHELDKYLESEKSLLNVFESFILKQHKEYGNPVEFEPWLAALKELRTLKQFSGNYRLMEFGLRILISALPSDFNATHALQILQFLKSLKRRKVSNRIKVLNSLICYINRQENVNCDWYDLSSRDSDMWLKVRLLEYIFEGIYTEYSRREEYNAILDKFAELAFFDRENFIGFISAVCGGTPFEPDDSSAYSISPYLQVFSLHAAWTQFKKCEHSMFNISKPQIHRSLCYLLVSLSSSWSYIRKATFNVLEMFAILLKKHLLLDEVLFIQQLTSHSEIIMDNEQLNISLFYLLSPSPSVQATLGVNLGLKLSTTRNILFEIAASENTPFYVSAKLLSILEMVNSEEILVELVGLCSRSLAHSKISSIPRFILSNFWCRVNEDTAEVLENSDVWDLAVKCIKHPKCEDLSPAVSLLKSVTKEVFENLPDNKKFELLELLVSIRSDTDCSEISAAIASAIKRINIDSKIILPLIRKMINVSTTAAKQRDAEKKTLATSIIESKNWKTGVSLLELIQTKKKLQNSDLLLKPLFDVLQFCFTQEEQTTFEYAKQLVLGCLLHCCQKISFSSQNVDKSSLNVELAVQCLRASPNPQTHHHALLLLSCLAGIVPNQVMHNIMAIFTFMGTSIARLDDEHSVKIVTQVVDAVVPVLLESMNSEEKDLQKVIAEILLVFVWALKDIPQHRRKPLFLQLITTLQPDRSLWILLLLLIENNVTQGNPIKAEGLPPNLFLGLLLTLSMTPQIILESILKIVHYINSLPAVKLNREACLDKTSHGKFHSSTSTSSKKLLDVEKATPKQLRHFVYSVFTFLNNLLSNNSLIAQVTEENNDEKSLEPAFRETIALLMKYIQTAILQYEVDRDKFWKAVIHQCYEILDKFVTLVPSEMLLNVIKQLLHQSMGSLRKKALDLFNVLLQNGRKDFSKTEKKSLIQLLEPIMEIVREIGNHNEQENEILQQTALISLKLMAKLMSQENLYLFRKVLVELCQVAKDEKCEGHLLGSVMLAISDQITCLKVHSVSQLPVFLPLLLKIFSDSLKQETSELGLLSVTTALYKVVDALPQFLSPYLHEILFNVCVKFNSVSESSDLSKKLFQIRQKIANNVESRVLIPSIADCYDKLIKEGKFDATGSLMIILSSNFAASSDVVKLVSDLTKFFFNALSFRSSVALSSLDVTLDDIDKVEGFVIEALVQFVLKLSESSFRPLYYQLCHWTTEHPERNITFFRLSCRLAESLKGLFVLFAGHFLNSAATLMDFVNQSTNKNSYFGDSPDSELKSLSLLENILKTLHLVFLYDSADTSNFLNKDKFEVLLHPLVDQLENTLGGMECSEKRRKELLTPCLAQMALALDDTLWKSLNYQILLKTKSTSPQVRIGALETIVAMAMKLGEDYLTLLPETIGSLAELLEDEDEKVEMAMKKAIQDLEEVLGQPLREYFQ